MRTARVVVLLVVLASPRLAVASPRFPDAVREDLSLSAAPPCTICHNNPSGGLGTATTPFATYLRSRGLHAGDVDSLRMALAAATAEKHDSDGDGVPDVDQLRAGRDPNVGMGDTPAPPSYGCGARVAPSAAVDPNGLLALAIVGLAWIARRRRSLVRNERRPRLE